MSRVPSPVLNRRIIADTALEMIDRHGYAAFSLPRLGDRLGVRTSSLYHHFRDRADILAEVARTVVCQTRLSDPALAVPWTEHFVQLALSFRRTILRHSNTAPVLLQFPPRDVLVSLYESAAAQFDEHAELPRGAQVLFLDGLEKLTIGSAIEAVHPRRQRYPDLDPDAQPRLAAAVRANTLDAEQLFVQVVRAFLAGVAGVARARSSQVGAPSL